MNTLIEIELNLLSSKDFRQTIYSIYVCIYIYIYIYTKDYCITGRAHPISCAVGLR